MHAVPDVSVVICAYTEERWDDLVAAVASIQIQTLQPRETIIVIDHNQALLERARLEMKDSLIIENNEERGLSGARNSGITIAQGSVIAFMDEDASAAPDWLACLAIHYIDSNIVGVGGSIEPRWANGRPPWFPAEFDWVVGCTYRGMPEATASVRNFIGCNMSFRRDVFHAVGGFRNGIGRVGTLPVGCEETELCIRINQHMPQAVIRYDPKARVIHRVPTGRGRWAYFRARCYAEGRSKALIANFVGTRDSLSSERAYTLRVLPRATIQALNAYAHGDKAGFRRAGAIVAGLALTAAGYLVASSVHSIRQGPAQTRSLLAHYWHKTTKLPGNN